jgi:hypothetical protein
MQFTLRNPTKLKIKSYQAQKTISKKFRLELTERPRRAKMSGVVMFGGRTLFGGVVVPP